MWLAVLASAWGGPLDQPDPDEMHGYRCAERPLTLANNVPLADRTLVDAPPGSPVYPAGFQSNLLPFATDGELKQAGKKRGLLVFPAVASLATAAVPVVADCEGPATDRDDFVRGCKLPLQCELLTTVEGQRVTFATRPQVATKFAPIESAKEALGLVAFVEPDLFLPLTPGELARWADEAGGYQATAPEVPWVEVIEHDQGWLVRAPRRVGCGCDHDVVRRAWWVNREGRSCLVQEAPVALAVAKSPTCVD
jgi:hypothetical protein